MKEKLKKIFSKRNAPLLAVILTSILFYIILMNFQRVGSFVGKILGYFSPFVIGVVIAYLLNPIVAFLTRVVFKNVKRKKVANALSVAITIVFVLTVAVILILVIVPEIFPSFFTT